MRIYIRRAVSRTKIDLRGATIVPTQCRVVLKSITRTILVYRQRRREGVRVFRLEGIPQFYARREALPWVICRLPPAFTLYFIDS